MNVNGVEGTHSHASLPGAIDTNRSRTEAYLLHPRRYQLSKFDLTRSLKRVVLEYESHVYDADRCCHRCSCGSRWRSHAALVQCAATRARPIYAVASQHLSRSSRRTRQRARVPATKCTDGCTSREGGMGT